MGLGPEYCFCHQPRPFFLIITFSDVSFSWNFYCNMDYLKCIFVFFFFKQCHIINSWCKVLFVKCRAPMDTSLKADWTTLFKEIKMKLLEFLSIYPNSSNLDWMGYFNNNFLSTNIDLWNLIIFRNNGVDPNSNHRTTTRASLFSHMYCCRQQSSCLWRKKSRECTF